MTFIGSHRFFQTLFDKSCSLAFKLILQKNIHDLSDTSVIFFSSQFVFINFILRSATSLRTLAINRRPNIKHFVFSLA